MGEQIYSYGYLQDRVVAQLRTVGTAMTLDAIADAVGLPHWAVEAGLETAMHFKQVVKVHEGFAAQKKAPAHAGKAVAAMKTIAFEGLQ